MKRIVTILLTTSLFVVVGLMVLNVLFYGNDPLVNKIGLNTKDRINDEVSEAKYPTQKIVAKADNIDVRVGPTILKTDTTYALRGIIYANMVTGEDAAIEFLRMYKEDNGREISIDRNGDLISFSMEGIYVLTFVIDTECYSVRLPVTRLKKA